MEYAYVTKKLAEKHAGENINHTFKTSELLNMTELNKKVMITFKKKIITNKLQKRKVILCPQ